MIQVERDMNDNNGNPIRPSDNWFQKAAEKTVEAEAEGKDHDHDSDVYGHDDLRRPLLELFFKKCAYCEMNIAGGFPWEVEHFRPKGSVAERPDDHPGYYWLTYKWSNLYPSCTFCNQRRRDRGTYGDPRVRDAAGKQDQFPLSNENYRAMNHNENIDKEEEFRLLIDPCKDNPETEITFDRNGKVEAIGSSRKAEKTIEVINLNRTDRMDNRWVHICFLQTLVEDLVNEVEGLSNPAARSMILGAFSKRERPYAGLARAIKRDPTAFGF